jgi:hypothetical protein
VDHLVEPRAAEDRFQRGAIRHVPPHEFERLAQGPEFLKIPLLEPGIVEVVEIIKRPDGVAGKQQPLA